MSTSSSSNQNNYILTPYEDPTTFGDVNFTTRLKFDSVLHAVNGPEFIRCVEAEISLKSLSSTYNNLFPLGESDSDRRFECRMTNTPYGPELYLALGGPPAPNPPPPQPEDVLRWQKYFKEVSNQFDRQCQIIEVIRSFSANTSLKVFNPILNDRTKTFRTRIDEFLNIVMANFTKFKHKVIFKLKEKWTSQPPITSEAEYIAVKATMEQIQDALIKYEATDFTSDDSFCAQLQSKLQHNDFINAIKWYNKKLKAGTPIIKSEFVEEIEDCFISEGHINDAQFDVKHPRNAHSALFASSSPSVLPHHASYAASTTTQVRRLSDFKGDDQKFNDYVSQQIRAARERERNSRSTTSPARTTSPST